ncbi:MAG: radical SAM protein [Ruminococcaceae bacterium]|nr:radical SAM protein [Oscillospiraceae bacterium]
MKVISPVNEGVLTILKRFLKTEFRGRLSKYCVAEKTEDGVLLFNLMTREMVLLSEEEYSRVTQLDYLRQRWFVVPEGLDEQECMDFVRLVLRARDKEKDIITGYTIFTTTDCNARCFYCFELGRSRVPMSAEVAQKAADYIVDHCQGKKVRMTWFGGEPLMNPEAIDIICDTLHQAKVEFTSFMYTNGYLFNDAMVEKAVTRWNLKRLQITLDGTESVYNHVKAYIYREGNPYQIVQDNIRRLVDRSIKVIIRLNMDMHNAQDLLALVDEMSQRFAGQKNLSIYAYHLFKEGTTNAELHTDEEWRERVQAMHKLRERLEAGGLMRPSEISQKIRLNFCKVDAGKDITILPDGSIGLCDHFSESEFIGHIDREGLDAETMARWRRPAAEIPECADCFYYPECFRLENCTSSSRCYPMYRQMKQETTVQKMHNTYQKWLKAGGQLSQQDTDDLAEEC